jgi:hypothetical protein
MLPTPCWFLAWFNFRHVPPKRRLNLNGVISAMRTHLKHKHMLSQYLMCTCDYTYGYANPLMFDISSCVAFLFFPHWCANRLFAMRCSLWDGRRTCPVGQHSANRAVSSVHLCLYERLACLEPPEFLARRTTVILFKLSLRKQQRNGEREGNNQKKSYERQPGRLLHQVCFTAFYSLLLFFSNRCYNCIFLVCWKYIVQIVHMWV